MAARYIAAFVSMTFALMLLNLSDVLIVVYTIHLPFQYQVDWFLISNMVTAVLIALSVRLVTPSLRWRGTVLIALAWFIGMMCTFSILKWANYGGQFYLPIQLTFQQIFEDLSGQYRTEYFKLPLALPVAFLFTSFIVRQANRAVRKRHVVSLMIVGMALDWGTRLITGVIWPDHSMTPPPPIYPETRLAIRATWSAIASLCLFGTLAWAQWGKYGSRTSDSAQLPDIRGLLSPTALTKFMGQQRRLTTPPALTIGAILFVFMIAAFLIQDSPQAALILRRIVYFALPVFAVVEGMQAADFYSQEEILNLVQLSSHRPVDIWIALLQTTMVRLRWIILTFLGFLIITSLDTFYRFKAVISWQMGMPEILVIFAWLGMVTLGAAVGISAALHRRAKHITGMAPVVVLVIAVIILPNALGELGPKGWMSAAANMVAFSLIPYLGLYAFLRFETEADSAS